MLESFGVINAGLYALGALALILAPGPNSIFVFKTSTQYGSKPAFHAALAASGTPPSSSSRTSGSRRRLPPTRFSSRRSGSRARRTSLTSGSRC